MAGKRHIEAARLARLEARTRVIQGAGRFVFVIFCVALGFVVVATAFPQRRDLDELEAKLKSAKEREQVVMAERANLNTEYQALREDPAYLEIHARDRLDYCREGERVLRFRRDR